MDGVPRQVQSRGRILRPGGLHVPLVVSRADPKALRDTRDIEPGRPPRLSEPAEGLPEPLPRRG